MSDRRILELVISLIVIVLALFLLYSKKASAPKPAQQQPVQEMVKRGPNEMLTVEVEPGKPVYVGIIGTSRGDPKTSEAFNASVVEHLLQNLKRRYVNAVFSTGDLVSGLGKSRLPDSWILQQQLQEFSTLYKTVLPNVPFFPVMGYTETAASNNSQIFRENFELGTGHAFDATSFAYTVSIGPAFFVLMPTLTVDMQTAKVEASFPAPMLDWLDHTLKTAAQNHAFLFVVGHEPAFLPTVMFPSKNTSEKDAFWQVLVDNNVSAYFCSHDELYDRTIRDGVWQIVSGGGGAPYTEMQLTKPFFHCLLLTVPAKEKEIPNVEVLDENGNVKDSFKLGPESSLLHQFHVS